MTKEKKFRVWDKVANKMYYAGDGEFSIDLSGSLYDDSQTPPLNIDYRCVLLEYTGLKDKNGKEIASGDVLRCYCKGLKEVALDAHEVKLPVFYREIWSSKICDDGMWLPADIGEICGAVEIIGNIYENPELIK